MNVLFILGNGFDKTQGLETCYQDFYKDYQKLDAASELEAQLKKDIRKDYETWADLEVGLGQYSTKFDDINTFREVLSIVNIRLKDYLKAQELRINTLGLSQTKLISDLLHPEKWLEPKQISSYNAFITSLSIDSINNNCVSFNYTNTFESVFNDHEPLLGFRIAKRDPIYYRGLLHLHGSLDELILVGVNDVSQIANEKFRKDSNLIEEFVKPEINNGCENMKNEAFKRLIENANVIVLFGASVGITDSVWWQAIGDRIDDPFDPPRLIYYPYDTKKDTDKYQFRKLRWSKDYIDYLKKQMNIHASVEDLRDLIYVGINKPFLKLI